MCLVLCYFPWWFHFKASLISFDSNTGAGSIVKIPPISQSRKIRCSCLPLTGWMKKRAWGERSYVEVQLVNTGLNAVLEGGFYSYSQSHQSRGEVSATVWHLQNVFLVIWQGRFNNSWKNIWTKFTPLNHTMRFAAIVATATILSK